MTINLRDYQVEALDALRENIRQGVRQQILCMGTGAGKTHVAAAMIAAAQAKGSRVAFVADREVLVLQTSERLLSAGIDHGVTMGSQSFNRNAAVQVCSAQTLEARGWWPDIDLMIVDEAHTVRKQTVRHMAEMDILTIGLTATPFTVGLGKHYQTVVNACTTDYLVDKQWLVKPRVYKAEKIDMAGERLNAGEWSDKSVERKALPIIGDIVSDWVRYTNREYGGPAKSLIFCATVALCEEVCREFRDAGYEFEVASYRDRDKSDRRAKVRALERGNIHGLISCEALAKGFDVPDIKVISFARPYRNSLSGVIQVIGRGMRSAPGKDRFILLDHSTNYLRFAGEIEDFWANGVNKLDCNDRKESKASRAEPDTTRECKGCGLVMPAQAEVCPGCGMTRPPRPRGIEIVPGKLSEYNPLPVNGNLWPQLSRIAVDRYPDDSERARKFAIAQHKQITGRWPDYGRALEPSTECDLRLLEQVEDNVRKYINMKKRRGRTAARH